MIQPNGLDSRMISAQLDTCRTKNQMRLINRYRLIYYRLSLFRPFSVIFCYRKMAFKYVFQ